MLKLKTLSAGTADSGFSALAGYYDPGADRTPERAMDEYFQPDRASDIPAQWWCPRSELIQDGAKLQPGQIKEALEGRDAAGNMMVKSQPNRIGGFDLQFSAPKSVSVLYALGDSQQKHNISADMLASVRQTFTEMHAQGAFVIRRGAGGKIKEPARDVKIAIVLHYQSRAGDPQIHFHCILANSGIRQDGKSGAIYSNAFYNANRDSAISKRFLSHLAQNMEERGIATEAHSRTGFDVAGIPKELEQEFSKRRHAILAAEAPAETAQGRGRQRNRIARNTRQAKASLPDGAALEGRWQAEAAAMGHSPGSVWQGIRRAADSLVVRAQRLKLAMGETLAMVRENGAALAHGVAQRLRLVREARDMLPALQPDMARAVALYGKRVRDGMPLADAVAKFAAHDARNGQPARAAEWQARLSAEAKAPAPAMQPVRQMAPKMTMRMER